MPLRRAPLIPIITVRPGQLLTSDIAGPLTKTARGTNTHAIVVIDHFTKFVSIYELSDIKAATVADVLVDHMMHFGLAESILSDQGTQYQSQLLVSWRSSWSTRRSESSAYARRRTIRNAMASPNDSSGP